MTHTTAGTQTVLSWGCGVQSTTLAVMSALGDLPPLDTVITADTMFESTETYQMRDWYTAWLRERGVRVEIVTGGDIRVQGAQEHIHIPFWSSDGGPLQRQCTYEFKIMPVRRHIRELLGYDPSKPPHPPAGSVELWLGISLDEHIRATRMESRVKFIDHSFPLLRKRMSRCDCQRYLKDRGLPVPPKSACICCPYRRASEWLRIKQQSPQDWQAAVEFDETNRHNPLAIRGASTADELFIWRNHYGTPEPIKDADMEAEAEYERQSVYFQPPLICESGYCWA